MISTRLLLVSDLLFIRFRKFRKDVDEAQLDYL